MLPTLPPLYCPFPSATSPYAEAVDQATVTWATQRNLVTTPGSRQRVQAIGVGWLAARTNPTAPRDGLQLLTDWCTWLFLLDDLCDEGALGMDPAALQRAHARSLAILRGTAPSTQDGPAGVALADLAARMRSHASEAWWTRFRAAVATTFDASIWEASNRVCGITPDVQTYLTHRSSTGAMYTVLALAELIEAITLPDEVKEHPVVQGLESHAINAVCWANDILSLAKELQQGDVHNLVIALQHARHLRLHDAVYRAAALHDAQVRAFLDLQLHLPSFTPAVAVHVDRYVAVLRSWMRGNLDWALTSGRYLATMLAPSDAVVLA